MTRIIYLALFLFISISAHAFQNEKTLPDANAEAKAQKIFHEIRCLVCQGESLAESNADLAVNMRSLIRDKVAAGEDEGKIKQYLTWRYGDSILQEPPFEAKTWLLWLLPAVLAIFGFVIIIRMTYFKKHATS